MQNGVDNSPVFSYRLICNLVDYDLLIYDLLNCILASFGVCFFYFRGENKKLRVEKNTNLLTPCRLQKTQKSGKNMP